MDVTSLRERFVAAQLRGDRREGLRLLLDEGLGEGLSVPELHLGVIREAQREVGRLWESNQITVAGEHVATSIAELGLAQLYPHLPRQPDARCSVVLGCVQGEGHDFAARMVCDLMEMAGISVMYLGANVPHDNLVSTLRDRQADALALSVTLTSLLGSLEEAVRTVRASFGPTFPIYAGGLALESRDQSWVDRIGLSGAARGPDEVTTVVIEQLVGAMRPPESARAG